jgi:hypothetical protein
VSLQGTDFTSQHSGPAAVDANEGRVDDDQQIPGERAESDRATSRLVRDLSQVPVASEHTKQTDFQSEGRYTRRAAGVGNDGMG